MVRMESEYFGYTANNLADFSMNWLNSPSSPPVVADFIASDSFSEATTSSNSSLDQDLSSLLQNPIYRHDDLYANSAAYGVEVMRALRKLEDALMAPDEEEVASLEEHFLREKRRSPAYAAAAWNQDSPAGHMVYADSLKLNPPSPSNLKQLLIACAGALSENRLPEFQRLVEFARSAVSITGEPIQRLGAYMIEGLVARKELSGTKIYRALKCHQPENKDLLSYMHTLYEICPYLKFGYMAANGAIAEACKNDDRIHIIDFQIAQGTQWMTLLQALAARPGGPPRVRLTGIDDPMSQYARGAGLAAVGKRLEAISEKFKIPVEFHPVPVFAPDVTLEMLDVRPGEAVAVNFPLELHHTPDESVDVANPRDGLLRKIRSLGPKVVTLVEQESNTNTAPFPVRFAEALDYYSAMFESIDVTMGRDRKERVNVEQHCLARDIVNVIACEGRERVERHELLGKWKRRFMMAGFRPFPLNSYVNSVIRELLRCYSEHYTLVESDGAMLLGWKQRSLVSASAWN